MQCQQFGHRSVFGLSVRLTYVNLDNNKATQVFGRQANCGELVKNKKGS